MTGDELMTTMKVLRYGFTIVLILAIALLLMNGAIPKKYLKAVNGFDESEQRRKNEITTAHTEWQSFMLQSGRQISANENRIAAFKVTMDEAGPKAIQEYRAPLEILEQKNIALKKMLEAYNTKRRREQEDFQSTFRQRLDSIVNSIQKVLKDNG